MYKEKDGWLVGEFKFKNFLEALRFVNSVGEVAEDLNHHPNIELHSYNQVRISSVTHDTDNTITDSDYELFKRINTINV
ncbi:MAG: 4a-hydroxytetrahydrobiopterin dehydratase [Flavobacteriales bacterium]|nr:4a-hydroxytetrahydrobiopterin dehydratase [Flavobacteriales bacterium]